MKPTPYLKFPGRRRRDDNLLHQYSSRLGVFVPRHRAETSLLIAKREAERASYAKSEFLASMSHELRTPLNAIMGFSEILRAGPSQLPPPEKIREYAGDIHVSGQHLLTLINDILDLAKVEAGRVEISLTEVDVEDVADSILRMVRERAASAGLTITKELAPNLPLLVADYTRLKQVLLNLASNAIKFTPEGGHISLQARVGHKEELILCVADTGVGMKADDIPKALSPFEQLDAPLTKKAEGTGLGLPLAKSYTELMKGSLYIQSKPGLGTRVVLMFPKSSCRRGTPSGGGASV